MAGKYFSPYAPRRRRSARLVVIWMSLFVIILWLTWYYTSGKGAMSEAAERIRPGRGLNEAPYAGAGAGAGTGEGE
jgi:hypothetical protein